MSPDLKYAWAFVSIHALVRRATFATASLITASSKVSIHALVRRATLLSLASGSNFEVSIHALVRRATSVLRDRLSPGQFQSTPSYGGRHQHTRFDAAAIAFQSTPSYGGRPIRLSKYLYTGPVSIHALVRRATTAPSGLTSGPGSFNPRPRTEGDTRRRSVALGQIVSIHALVRRATLAGIRKAEVEAGFNPRPRTEGDAALGW